jgi:hypothetical protein
VTIHSRFIFVVQLSLKNLTLLGFLQAASGLHLLMFICERLNKMGWSPLCTLDVGSKVNDDDDAHLYSEDGEMFIFHMAKGDKDEKAMKNGLVGVEGGGGNNKGTEEGGGEERQKKAAKKMPKIGRGESAKKDDEEEDGNGARVTAAAAGRRMSTV